MASNVLGDITQSPQSFTWSRSESEPKRLSRNKRNRRKRLTENTQDRENVPSNYATPRGFKQKKRKGTPFPNSLTNSQRRSRRLAGLQPMAGLGDDDDNQVPEEVSSVSPKANSNSFKEETIQTDVPQAIFFDADKEVAVQANEKRVTFAANTPINAEQIHVDEVNDNKEPFSTEQPVSETDCAAQTTASPQVAPMQPSPSSSPKSLAVENSNNSFKEETIQTNFTQEIVCDAEKEEVAAKANKKGVETFAANTPTNTEQIHVDEVNNDNSKEPFPTEQPVSETDCAAQTTASPQVAPMQPSPSSSPKSLAVENSNNSFKEETIQTNFTQEIVRDAEKEEVAAKADKKGDETFAANTPINTEQIHVDEVNNDNSKEPFSMEQPVSETDCAAQTTASPQVAPMQPSPSSSPKSLAVENIPTAACHSMSRDASQNKDLQPSTLEPATAVSPSVSTVCNGQQTTTNRTRSTFAVRWDSWRFVVLAFVFVAIAASLAVPTTPPQRIVAPSVQVSQPMDGAFVEDYKQDKAAVHQEFAQLTAQINALQKRVNEQARQTRDTSALVLQLNQKKGENEDDGAAVVTAQQLQTSLAELRDSSAQQLTALRQNLATEAAKLRAGLQRTQSAGDEVNAALENMRAQAEALQAKFQSTGSERDHELTALRQTVDQARAVLQQEWQTKFDATVSSLEESYSAPLEALQRQVAEIASLPRSEDDDRAPAGEVVALAQKFADVESRIRGYMQTQLARVSSHIKSLKDDQASTQKQLVEGLHNDQLSEQLKLAQSLREEFELAQEDQQQLARRAGALERKTTQLTSEIATLNDLRVEATVLQSSLQNAVDVLTTSMAEQQQQRDTLKQSVSETCARAVADHVNQRFGAEVTQADWAQSHMGGRVLPQMTSQPLAGTTPALAISHDNLVLGRCFLFKGSAGQLAVRLAVPVHVSAVTIRHVTPRLKPANVVSGAPRRFEIWGFHEQPSDKGVLLLEAAYDATANAVQTFAVEAADSVRAVQLRVLDNHGASNTCVYRLQVHGTPQDGAQRR